MKRMWLGVAILAVVLALGIGLTVCFDRLHRPLGEKLEAAAERALAGD